MDDDDRYRWETGYEKSWEVIRETEGGLLQPTIDELARKARRGQLLHKNAVRLGMMRHVFVVVDRSEDMLDIDLKPARINVALKLVEMFFTQFFDQNPISQLGLVTTSNKKAEKIIDLNGNMKVLLDGLKKVPADCSGEPSLQNSLDVCLAALKHLPKHTSKEVIIILGSLTSCDPSNINTTLDSLVKNNIRVSIIGLSAEVFICKKIAKMTKGSYHVIMDEHHFKDLLTWHVSPPPASQTTESSIIRMGFPRPVAESEGIPSMCVCHIDSENPNFSKGGYFCPQCNSKYCDLPVECRICGLTLVSAAHLARSYHHLFPLEPFIEEGKKESCFSCTTTSEPVYRCNSCSHLFCLDCDSFIHETMHVCPGCASFQNTGSQMEI